MIGNNCYIEQFVFLTLILYFDFIGGRKEFFEKRGEFKENKEFNPEEMNLRPYEKRPRGEPLTSDSDSEGPPDAFGIVFPIGAGVGRKELAALVTEPEIRGELGMESTVPDRFDIWSRGTKEVLLKFEDKKAEIIGPVMFR